MTRVLISRPAGQQQALIEAFADQGIEADWLPAMAIKGIDDIAAAEQADDQAHKALAQAIKSRILELDNYDALIFISSNAVKHGLAWIDQYWPQLPVAQHYYAIGKATARTLAEQGLLAEVAQKSQIQAMNSEALLEHAQLQSLDEQKILIFRGIGGREFLAEQLRKRGAQVDYCEVYQRTLPDLAPGSLAQQIVKQPQAVLVNSTESLDNLRQFAARDGVLTELLQCPVVLPSKRVADYAQTQGFSQPTLAVNASDDAMLAATLKLLQHAKS